MPVDLATVARLAVASLVGLAVGVEREWSGHSTGPGARFAGARTFLLLGLVGGVAGWLLDSGFTATSTALIVAAALLVISAYVMAARRGGEAVDGTTEAAALAVLTLAVLAGLGATRLAAGAAAVVVMALREKSRIHAFVARIGELEMRAGLQFAVFALVLLPLLPEGPFGPLGGVEPRKLWMVVLLVSGLNFLGYVARRAWGEHRGYVVAGLLGGMVSSTAVALSFARQSQRDAASGHALGLGVMGACTVLIPRVMVVTLALNPGLALALVPLLTVPFLLGTVVVGVQLRRSPLAADAPVSEARNPLRLGTAVLMALSFQAVLMTLRLVQDHFGAAGVLPTAALLGLTDMDALTLSMSRLGTAGDQIWLGARAIAVGVLSNTILKLLLALVIGRGTFRIQASVWLTGLGLASLLGLWLAW